MILSGLFEIKREKQEEDIQENDIDTPPSLWSVEKKYHEATFMRISGFVCKYTCSMSCNKGEGVRLGQMVKEISFWYGEQVE